MSFPRLHPASWLPHSLRQQFLFAVIALTLLILAAGITAVYALHTSTTTIHELGEESLVQMLEAQDMVQHTFLIMHESYHLVDTKSIADLQDSHKKIFKLLGQFDDFVDRLAVNVGGKALLDLHQSSQSFRNTVNIVVYLRERELHAVETTGDTAQNSPLKNQNYLHDLHVQAEVLTTTALLSSKDFVQRYREAMQQLDELTQRNTYWVMLLLAACLLLAWVVAHWFLGHHVLGRLLQISSSLRLGDHDDGTQERPASTSVRDEIDEMTHAVELFQEDRYKLKQSTEGLRLARDAAEAANKAKSVLLANMSHELRTPLNAILGFSTLMRQDPLLSEGVRQNADIINRSGEHLLSLINDILEMARIESGQLQHEDVPFDLSAVIRDVTDMMAERARAHGLQLSLEQSSHFPSYIVGDEARLRQILNNLLSNAIKYTQRGCVTLRLSTKQEKGSKLLIEVEDTGVGIPPEEQQQIFKPFVQLGKHGISKGTGLGLAITHQFVQMMGGSINLESEPGKGSRFSVELPLIKAKESDINKLKKADKNNVSKLAPEQPEYRILIVEDQPDNQLLLSQLHESVGFRVELAENGAQAVQLFQNWHPHFIWMDLRMPIMDGMEATRRIRELPDGKEVKIVAVTASVLSEERSKIYAVGMDGYVRKPYRASDVYDCLARHLGVKYLFEGARETPEQEVILTPEMLNGLPEAFREELVKALESLEHEQIVTVIQRVVTHDQALQKKLMDLARNFDYAIILQALQKDE